MSNKETYIKQLKAQKKEAFLKSNKALRQYKTEKKGLELQHTEIKEKGVYEGKECYFVSHTPYSPLTELYNFYENLKDSCGRNIFKITNISERKILEEIENDFKLDKYCQNFWETPDEEYFEIMDFDFEDDDFKYRNWNPDSEDDTKKMIDEMKAYINRRINQVIKIRENNYLERDEFYLPNGK